MVLPPFSLTTSITLSPIDLTRFESVLVWIACLLNHCLRISSLRSCLFLYWRPLPNTTLVKMPQTFSIRLRSGLCAGQSITEIFFSASQFVVNSDRWILAQSCMNFNPRFANGNKLVVNMSVYFRESIVCSQMTRSRRLLLTKTQPSRPSKCHHRKSAWTGTSVRYVGRANTTLYHPVHLNFTFSRLTCNFCLLLTLKLIFDQSRRVLIDSLANESLESLRAEVSGGLDWYFL